MISPPTRDGLPFITAFVLTKNESLNIGACVEPLRRNGVRVIVFDSGSTDNTRDIALRFEGVELEAYSYSNHADAYNYISAVRCSSGEWAIILDADMQVSDELLVELCLWAKEDRADVVRAPILMYSAGEPLVTGSLCPPKAILFRGGREHFEGCGHGERPIGGVRLGLIKSKLIHNDRKPYSEYLHSQLRYADNFFMRAKLGKLTWRDAVRIRSVLLAVLVPLYSYIFRLGILSGRAGKIYAIDRAIAELLHHRQSLVGRLNELRSTKERG